MASHRWRKLRLGERALEVWETSLRAGSTFIGQRRARASSMVGVEGASMTGVEGAGYQLLKRGKWRRVMGE
jgi:hypothetical protein